jgi:succinate--hydroxymethylglutarate CoA-transferase
VMGSATSYSCIALIQQHPRAGKIKLAAPAVSYDGSKPQVSQAVLSLRIQAEEQVYRPPPYLGQHTDEILAELGYQPAEIEKLRSSGAI